LFLEPVLRPSKYLDMKWLEITQETLGIFECFSSLKTLFLWERVG
tara:strand:- start:282 stop:416 length:135 start_codon:yes stop_codon:yes gene_type:complete